MLQVRGSLPVFPLTVSGPDSSLVRIGPIPDGRVCGVAALLRVCSCLAVEPHHAHTAQCCQSLPCWTRAAAHVGAGNASSVLHYAPWGHLQGQSSQLLRGSREHRRSRPLRTSVLTPFSSPFGEAHYFRASRERLTSAYGGCRASSRDCVHRSSAKNQQRGASSCRTPTPVVENTSPPSAVLAAPAIVEEFIAPAPAVSYAVPAPTVFAAPAPVLEYISPAPAVSYAASVPCSTQRQRGTPTTSGRICRAHAVRSPYSMEDKSITRHRPIITVTGVLQQPQVDWRLCSTVLPYSMEPQ